NVARIPRERKIAMAVGGAPLCQVRQLRQVRPSALSKLGFAGVGGMAGMGGMHATHATQFQALTRHYVAHFAAYASQATDCTKKSCSSTPMGLLKKQASCLSMPVSPRRWANRVNRAMSSSKGAAKSESHPCQMNCRIIFVLRKPRKWMW